MSAVAAAVPSTPKPVAEARRRPIGAYVAFVTICAIWGTTFLAIRVAVATIPTFLLTGTRFIGAGLILLTICLVRRESFPPTRRQWIDQMINGVFMVAIANTSVVWAEQYIASGLAAIVAATIPLWMALLEAITRTAPMTGRKAAGLVVGFSGVVLLLLPDLQQPSTNTLVFAAVAMVCVNAIGWDIGSLRSKIRPATAAPMAVASIQMLTGGVIVAVLAILHGDLAHPGFTFRATAALLYLMIFGSVIAYSAYLYALRRIEAGKLSTYAYVNPAVAVIVGALFLGEPLTVRMVGAMAVILAGVAIAQSDRWKRVRA